MKNILLQLNNLKNIKADSEWKERSREILLSQISGSFSLEKEEEQTGLSYYFKNFLHQPALVVAVIIIVVLGGGGVSIGASFDSKPGDSLYIAKIISEKAQLTFTFDEKEKTKLNIEFAKNRAKELAQVLEGNNEGDDSVAVEKLSNNFKKEISATRERLSRTGSSNMVIEDSSEVFSATVGKSSEGIEIYNSEVKEDIVAQPEVNNQASATSSDSNIVIRKIGVIEALDEVEKMFSDHDYDGALDKLNKVEDVINGNVQPSTDNSEGEVLGEKSESATSTGE